tara:strand:+ start:383 stop:685 length:303 start_codon:yes stop_codon:yes gene_type:complete
MKLPTFAFTVLFSGAAFGACVKPDILELPLVPNGEEASADAMLEAQSDVNAFVKAGEGYLECGRVEPFIHNLYVYQIERAAGTYNLELERFKQRSALANN